MKSKILEPGQKFNRLTVIKLDHIETKTIGTKRPFICNKEYYLCKCDCGNECIKEKILLQNGYSKSCGCLHKETIINIGKNNTTHGKTKTRIYSIFRQIKQRCYDQNNGNYYKYGGRGITMCQEWKNDFMSFYNWAINNGYKEGLTIDRINNNGNYEPSNCRWTTAKIQARNKRNNHLITYNNETHCISEWAEKMNKGYHNLYTSLFYRKTSKDKIFSILNNKN